TLHETVSRKIHRTKTGRIFTQDLKNIYSILLLNLDLSEKPSHNKNKNGLSLSHIFSLRSFGKQHPYSFYINDAINRMGNLCLDVNLSPSTSTSISYQIKPDLASSLVQIFFIAKLLHTPSDRTRSKPKENVVMQPTPKGVAILYAFCKQHGIKNDSLPLIIKSNFNSMNLTIFDRNQFDDRIVYSDYLIHLLFLKLMGPSPNIWSPQNDSDPIPIDIVDELSNSQKNQDFNNSGFLKPSKTENKKYSNHSASTKSSKISPFAHKFFTNPESDSHVQYYVSSKGVRLYYNYRYSSNESTPDVKDITVQYSFIGKAAWQWLMDCTDITSKDQAADIMSLFVKFNLIKPVLHYPSTAPQTGFQLSKTAFYTLTEEGWETIKWDRLLNKKLSNETKIKRIISLQERLSELSRKPSLLVSNSNGSNGSNESNEPSINSNIMELNQNLSLKKVLKDPGLRYLFRKHLEKELCVENFDSYNEIMKFNSEMMKLKKYLKQKEEIKKTLIKDMSTMLSSMGKDNNCPKKSRLSESNRNRLIISISNDCMTSAYNIYGTYLTIGAPYELNINHLLKQEINKVMMHPTSPINQKTHSEILSEFGSSGLDLSNNNRNLTNLNLSIDIAKINLNSEKTHSFLSDSDSSLDSGSEDNFCSLNGQGYDKESTLIEREIPLTPTEATVKDSLSLLNQIYPLLNKVSSHMYTLMQIDSLPKFFKSNIFND
ncbi:GTPase-activating protein SST2, partial [Ascoidea rubescens DSM 1968]